jgi:enoyl-CoA hydratase
MRERTSMTLQESVARIVMDDGKVNAMSTAMLEEIEARLASAAESARVTVLMGRPGIFSAGFDLNVFQDGETATRAMLEAGVRVLSAIIDHPHPLLTVCTGHAYPMGAFLMLAADVRLGVAGDWRIGMNEVAIGLTVPSFALALARHRLTPAGFGLISSGTMLDPAAAVAAGYMDRVVQSSALDDAARGEARRLAGLDLAAYRETKARMRGTLREELATAGIG